MGASYAGVLGPVAFLTTIARGLLHGGAVEAILHDASIVLMAFAAVGYVIGRLAERTVDEAVRATLEAHLAKQPGVQAAAGEA